jgi:hypothetical protein
LTCSNGSGSTRQAAQQGIAGAAEYRATVEKIGRDAEAIKKKLEKKPNNRLQQSTQDILPRLRQMPQFFT